MTTKDEKPVVRTLETSRGEEGKLTTYTGVVPLGSIDHPFFLQQVLPTITQSSSHAMLFTSLSDFSDDRVTTYIIPEHQRKALTLLAEPIQDATIVEAESSVEEPVQQSEPPTQLSLATNFISYAKEATGSDLMSNDTLLIVYLEEEAVNLDAVALALLEAGKASLKLQPVTLAVSLTSQLYSMSIPGSSKQTQESDE